MLYVGSWFLPVLILILVWAATVNLILILRRQRKKVMALVNECRLTALVWEGWVRAVSSHRLIPGDIIVLRQGKAVCDIIILQGSCLVMESMLSGEVSNRLYHFSSGWGFYLSRSMQDQVLLYGKHRLCVSVPKKQGKK